MPNQQLYQQNEILLASMTNLTMVTMALVETMMRPHNVPDRLQYAERWDYDYQPNHRDSHQHHYRPYSRYDNHRPTYNYRRQAAEWEKVKPTHHHSSLYKQKTSNEDKVDNVDNNCHPVQHKPASPSKPKPVPAPRSSIKKPAEKQEYSRTPGTKHSAPKPSKSAHFMQKSATDTPNAQDTMLTLTNFVGPYIPEDEAVKSTPKNISPTTATSKHFLGWGQAHPPAPDLLRMESYPSTSRE